MLIRIHSNQYLDNQSIYCICNVVSSESTLSTDQSSLDDSKIAVQFVKSIVKVPRQRHGNEIPPSDTKGGSEMTQSGNMDENEMPLSDNDMSQVQSQVQSQVRYLSTDDSLLL